MIPDIVATERHSHVQSRDMCVSAPTGSGKTLVFVLGVLQVLSIHHICCWIDVTVIGCLSWWIFSHFLDFLWICRITTNHGGYSLLVELHNVMELSFKEAFDPENLGDLQKCWFFVVARALLGRKFYTTALMHCIDSATFFVMYLSIQP